MSFPIIHTSVWSRDQESLPLFIGMAIIAKYSDVLLLLLLLLKLNKT